MSDDKIPRSGGGFWSINIGHILTTASVLMTLGAMYGTVSNKLESQGAAIISLQQQANVTSAQVASLQISNATQAQDEADLHKTMDEDFSRRLGKLEDKMDK